ncbi:MAG TPA: hypothetical protein PKJ97_01195, partial [Candidatus Bilamarchaeaceae archaeon]|nr:hypothetical protein [Candidatus Bilamarchaeaceae archaeon]
MPAIQAERPAVSETAQRRERLDSILYGFGIDAQLVHRKLLELNMLPIGAGLYTGGLATVSQDSTPDEVAYALAAWLYNSRIGTQTGGGRGLDGLCESEMRFASAVTEIFRGSYYTEGGMRVNRPAQRIFDEISSEHNLTKLREASFFQRWATERGVSQELTDQVGSLLFGASWEYGRITGSALSMQPDGTYYFKTQDAIDLRQAVAALSASPATEFAASSVPVRMGAPPEELPAEEQFRRFYSIGKSRMFSSNVEYFFRDEARDYRRKHRADGTSLDQDTLTEATAFYLWAIGSDTGSPRLSSDEMERIGREKYGDVWEFGQLIGKNLSYSASGRNAGKYVFIDADNVKAARDGFSSLPVPKPPGAAAAETRVAAATEETATGLSA